MTDLTFTLSIEPVEGPSFVHGYHLGTEEATARQMAVDIFAARNGSTFLKDHKGRTMFTRTVALIRDRKIFDVFDGKWRSDEAYPNDAETLACVARMKNNDDAAELARLRANGDTFVAGFEKMHKICGYEEYRLNANHVVALIAERRSLIDELEKARQTGAIAPPSK